MTRKRRLHRLFAGTIAENITLFSREADDGLMRQVAEQAGIDREVGLMPLFSRTCFVILRRLPRSESSWARRAFAETEVHHIRLLTA